MLAAFMVLMCQLVLLAGVIYALGARDKCVGFPSFYPLFLALTAGLTGALLTGDVFNLFVFTELLVVAAAALTALSDDRLGVEAAYKYLLMSLIASWLMLLACGTLYVATGTLNMADLALRIAAQPGQPLVATGAILLFAAFMIKSAVFPFHFWQPDFHTVSPTAVSAMLSSVVVKLGVYGFIRMTTLLFVFLAPQLRLLLMALGLAGIIYGGLAAIGTHNVKRVLAFSTMAQIGFVLVGIGWGTTFGLAAALVFAFSHSLIKAALLMLAGAVASRAPVKSADFSVLTGAGRAMPRLGILFFAGGMALAGIPPTSGFVGKALVFAGGVDADAVPLLLLAGIASALTLVYVSRTFVKVWWQSSASLEDVKPTGDRVVAPALLVVLVIVLGLWPEPLVALGLEVSQWLAEPMDYVRAVVGG
jgi:multicomponent Na+:H+ antiporter subunit D